MNAVFSERNPFQALAAACKRIEENSIYYIRQILSPLLNHENSKIHESAMEVVYHTEKNGTLTPESKTNLLVYQCHDLERKLAPFGVVLDPYNRECDGDLVTYKGHMHGKLGVQRVLCRTRAPAKVTDFNRSTDSATSALKRDIEILEALQNDRHFIQMLIWDKTSRQMFYVTDHDWQAENLSDLLLSDLRSCHPAIGLNQKMQIVKDMAETALSANRKNIVLRSFTAESFLVKRSDTEMRRIQVIFWNIGAARRCSIDTNGTHFLGKWYIFHDLISASNPAI